MPLFSSEEFNKTLKYTKATKPASNVGRTGSAELNALKSEVNTLKTGHDTLKTGHDALKTDHDALKTSHDALKTGHDVLKTDHDALKTGHDALKTDHDALKTDHDALKTGHDVLKTGHDVLKTDHDALKTDHDALKTGHDALKTDHDTLKTDHDALKTDYDITLEQTSRIFQAQNDAKCPNGLLQGKFILDDIKNIEEYDVTKFGTPSTTVTGLDEKFCLPENVGKFFATDGTLLGFYDEEKVDCENGVSHVNGTDTYTLSMSGGQCVMTETTV